MARVAAKTRKLDSETAVDRITSNFTDLIILYSGEIDLEWFEQATWQYAYDEYSFPWWLLSRVFGTMWSCFKEANAKIDVLHIQRVLCLIRSSPNLQNLNIRLDTELNSSDDMDLLDWMVLSGDMKLEQLEYIEIQGMVGSRTEFQFIKLLLASAPSLQLIKLVKNRTVDDPNKELRILQELLQFPRVSPTAQIKWIN
ncbi:hypothetical protein POM88_036972 [Heracleum sosnowskyi]|uniref:FBD domain-containing protein n=1 Tax=Heracleum sosnowskyi TaxID=360622 RepID=A0AAD8HP96_9APIA|nr:hypothetical protein POM88_036972 [Heracleum sosnowskyi]